LTLQEDDVTTGAATATTEAAKPQPRRGRSVPETAALVVVLVGMCVFFAVQSEYFLTGQNITNILVSASVIGIVAAPATLLLVSGQFDLSVGSGAALIGVVMAWGAAEYGIPQAILLCIITGILIGVVNGISVTIIGINALITTLAMLAILRGLALVLAGGQTLLLPDFGGIGNARPLFDVPAPVFIFIAVTIVTALAMRYTIFGRSMYAIGANPVAARLAGIKTKRAIFTGFILSGLAVVLGGLILVSQLGAASPQAATGLELAVVTAVILGGASLAGGRGTIFGTVLGVMILGVMNNGMTLMNIDSFWQQVAQGCLLLFAVGFDQLRLRLTGKSE
jgi:ribose transport system permease protein